MKPIIMALDPLEKERLRKRMALRMGIFLEGATSVDCVSGHYNEEPALCELCQTPHATEVLVVKNRSNKKMRLDLSCLKEMIRFKVTDVADLARWLEKLKELKIDVERRKEEALQEREEQRRLLGKKVIVRKRTLEST